MNAVDKGRVSGLAEMNIPCTKEHGAWVMFAIAFVTGMVKAGSMEALSLIVFVSMALFLMAKAPVATFFRRGDRSVLPFVALYLALGSAGCLYSIVKKPDLIFLYGAGIVLVILYFLFGRKSLPVLSEASAMATMGLVASIAASIGSEIVSHLYLWFMFFLFYLASSFRVRLTMKKYRVIGGAYSCLMVLLSGVMAFKGELMFLAFLPLMEDFYAALRGGREEFKRIGIIETVKSVIFALAVIIL